MAKIRNNSFEVWVTRLTNVCWELVTDCCGYFLNKLMARTVGRHVESDTVFIFRHVLMDSHCGKFSTGSNT